MILQFGTHKGKPLEIIPESYLMWLSKPIYSGKFYKNIRSTELNWKVPFDVKIAARKLLESRGWQLKGEHWEK